MQLTNGCGTLSEHPLLQVRYGRETLNAPEGFFAGLVDSVVTCMGEAYPELVKSRDLIHDVIS